VKPMALLTQCAPVSRSLAHEAGIVLDVKGGSMTEMMLSSPEDLL